MDLLLASTGFPKLDFVEKLVSYHSIKNARSAEGAEFKYFMWTENSFTNMLRKLKKLLKMLKRFFYHKMLAFDNTVISSCAYDYRLDEVKGEGCFGEVFKGIELNSNTPVAIKFQDIENAEEEFEMMKLISDLDPDKYNLIRFYEYFLHDEEGCLVYELLDRSLRDVRKEMFPLQLEEVALILKQLLQALQGLEKIGVIHSDIKSDNIMLVNHQEQPFRVKLIDFGCAFITSMATAGATCQPDGLKAPELILGLDFTAAIDMWTLGLLTASMFLGFALYPGRCDYDTLRLIIDTQGPPPADLLNEGKQTERFFTKNGDVWRLKTPEEYRRESGVQTNDKAQCRFKNLHELKYCYKATNELEHRDQEEFIDLLEKMLRLDHRERIKPTEALQHNFITRKHFVNACPNLEKSFQKISDQHIDSTNGQTVDSHYKTLINGGSDQDDRFMSISNHMFKNLGDSERASVSDLSSENFISFDNSPVTDTGHAQDMNTIDSAKVSVCRLTSM